MYQSLSARLRMDVRKDLGAAVLTALLDHLYHKALNYFDPSAQWQTLDILALSELAHRLRHYAANLDASYPARLEAQRLSALIWADYQNVYDTAMERMQPQDAIGAAA